MKDSTVRDKFVELRAQGKSFAAIAEELCVSKPTLIEWSRDMQVTITNLRALNNEALCERYRLTKERQLQLISCQLQAVEAEIQKRGLTHVSTDKLYSILFKLTDELREEDKPITLQHSGMTSLDLATITTWEA